MLRYNNNSSTTSSGTSTTKPVDYYRPLTVDVSVEYELPKEVAPPKGSAPLLIIHPSAYFRPTLRTTNQSPSTGSSRITPIRPTTTNTTTSRLGDIASTLYYLSTNGHPNSELPQNSHIKSSISHNRSSYTNYGDGTHTRTTRSRTAAATKAQLNPTCDDYPRTAPVPPKKSTSSTVFGTSYSGNPSGNSQTTFTNSNKRLRMMSSSNGPNPTLPTQQKPNGLSVMMEPLNLALGSTSHHPYNHTQFTTFLGYGNNRIGNSPSISNQNLQPSLHYMAPNEYLPYNNQGTTTTTTNGSLRSGCGSYIKAEGPVPVDKGSGGSDSGVCSDSDDVSPPMAGALPFLVSTNVSSTRRSTNPSQEFPSSGAGCYCCCCPMSTSITTPTTRKSKLSTKGHQPPFPLTQTTNSYGGNFLMNNVIQGSGFSEDGTIGGLILSQSGGGAGIITPLGGSPMDSSNTGSPHLFHQHHRKWYPPNDGTCGGGPLGNLPDSFLLMSNAQTLGVGSFGKSWYQV